MAESARLLAEMDGLQPLLEFFTSQRVSSSFWARATVRRWRFSMRCSRGRRLYSSRLSRCKITCGPYIVAAEERMMRNGPERRMGSHGPRRRGSRGRRSQAIEGRSARPWGEGVTAPARYRTLRRPGPQDGACLLLSHVDKSTAKNAETTQGYSGSTAWNNTVRAHWYLRSEVTKAACCLELVKANHAAAGAQSGCAAIRSRCCMSPMPRQPKAAW